MPLCIYCRLDKPPDDFNREHVVQEAFGRFKNNLVLHELVCEECNEYFGNGLDLALARDSLEGLHRYERGLKEATVDTVFGRGDLSEGRLIEGGKPGRFVIVLGLAFALWFVVSTGSGFSRS